MEDSAAHRPNPNPKPWHRLSFKLTAWVGGSLLILTLAAPFLARYSLEQSAVNQMLQTGFWFSDTVKRATNFSMLKDQRETVHATIEAMGGQEGVEVIRVFNKQGRIMFSSRKAEMGQMVDMQAEACFACHFRNRPLERVPPGRRHRIFTTKGKASAASHRVLGVITPIYSEKSCSTDPCHAHPPEQKVLGVLDVGMSLQGVDSQVARSMRAVVALSLLMFLVVAAVVMAVGHIFLNRPLGRLLSATRLISQGDYQHPLTISSRDEIGQLAGSFEHMRRSIKEKTEALQESRRRFQTLFEQVPCYISVQDRDFRLVAVNRMFAHDFGNAIGEFCYAAYKGRQTRCPGCAVEKCFGDGELHSAEETVVGRNGRNRYFLNLAAPITDKDGEILTVMEIATDVTELRHLEEELRRSEEKYRLFFNNDPNAIFVFDQGSLEILDANHRALSEYGYQRGNLIGTSFLDLTDRCDQARLRALLDQNGGLLPRLHQVRQNGEVFMVNLRASYGEHLGRRAVIAATADISENLRTEQQLFQAAKMATLGEMSAGMAHELNQPLSILSTGGSILLKQACAQSGPNLEVLKEVAEEIAAQVRRATGIINHLREFGRKSQVQRSKINLAEPIKGALELMGSQMAVNDVQLEVDLCQGLPPIWGDANRLEQVFINLLLNARDSIEERRRAQGNLTGRVQIKARANSGQVHVTVSDNGLGIKTDLRERIFEPFFTTKEVGKGTGLGLSISYGIVRDYGGSIEVDSTHKGGASFDLSFPFARENA